MCKNIKMYIFICGTFCIYSLMMLNMSDFVWCNTVLFNLSVVIKEGKVSNNEDPDQADQILLPCPTISYLF